MSTKAKLQRVYDALIELENTPNQTPETVAAVTELHDALNAARKVLYPDFNAFLVMIDRAPTVEMFSGGAGEKD